MKKTNFKDKRVHSVAMSQETGCIVMLMIAPDQTLDGLDREGCEAGRETPRLKVVGSLDRAQSVKLAEEIMHWTASIAKDVKQAVKLHSVN